MRTWPKIHKISFGSSVCVFRTARKVATVGTVSQGRMGEGMGGGRYASSMVALFVVGSPLPLLDRRNCAWTPTTGPWMASSSWWRRSSLPSDTSSRHVWAGCDHPPLVPLPPFLISNPATAVPPMPHPFPIDQPQATRNTRFPFLFRPLRSMQGRPAPLEPVQFPICKGVQKLLHLKVFIPLCRKGDHLENDLSEG